MSEVVCRECGNREALKSRFDAHCTECGSEDLDEVDAYDPVEHELRCEYCGYNIDTSARDDSEWSSDDDDTPTSVDDPCPICGHSLVPASESRSVREMPEFKLARAAAARLHREHPIPGPPYDLRPLATALGLEVKVAVFAHDGMLVGDVVEIPSSAPPAAQRFALAHEIAHFVLRHEGDRAKAEPEANALASELLVPRDALKAAIVQERSARALRTKFGVSRDVIVYALMSARQMSRVRP